MLLLEIFFTFAFFAFLSLRLENMIVRFSRAPYMLFFLGDSASRFIRFYILILALYLLILKHGSSDVLPGVFAQFFLLMIRYKELRQLCERCLVITIPLHLSLSEKIEIECVIYIVILLILSLFLVEWLRSVKGIRDFGLSLHSFLLLFYLFDPALAFWGACLCFHFFIFYSLDFLVGKRKEGALQALTYLSLVIIFMIYFYFDVFPTNLLFPCLLNYFQVQTIGELVLLCGLSLMAGACIIFALVDERGPGWVPFNFYLLVCVGMTLCCLFYHKNELYAWLKDLVFFFSCFFIYLVTIIYIIPQSIKETLPYFFGGLGLYYSQVYVLLSPGMQSWVLGLGDLTLLIDTTKKFLLGGSNLI